MKNHHKIFIVDVHKDQLIYFDDHQPIIPQKKSNQRGRKTPQYQAQTQPVRVDHWKEAQPEAAWQRYKLRDSTQGELIGEIVHDVSGYETKMRLTHTAGISLCAGNSIRRKPANILYQMLPSKPAQKSSRKCKDNAFESNKRLKMVKVSQEWPIIRPESGIPDIIVWL
jgi:hypothetical protein